MNFSGITPEAIRSRLFANKGLYLAFGFAAYGVSQYLRSKPTESVVEKKTPSGYLTLEEST